MTDTPTTYRVFDRETFADEMERIGIPRHMFAGITRYVFDGIGGGDFQTAIFQNDFVRAAGQADDKNQHCLFEYARLLYNHVPIDAWGSRDKVSAWVKVHTTTRRLTASASRFWTDRKLRRRSGLERKSRRRFGKWSPAPCSRSRGFEAAAFSVGKACQPKNKIARPGRTPHL